MRLVDARQPDGGATVTLDLTGRIGAVEGVGGPSIEFIHDDAARLNIGGLAFLIGIAHGGNLASPILTITPEPAAEVQS